MSSKRIISMIEAHARTLTLTLAMLIAVFAAAPARAQGPPISRRSACSLSPMGRSSGR